MKRTCIGVMAVVCICVSLLGGAAPASSAGLPDPIAGSEHPAVVDELPLHWLPAPLGESDALDERFADIASAAAFDLYVSETFNDVFGTVAPNARVGLRLFGVGGIEKGSNLLEADGQGNFTGVMFPNGVQGELAEPADIVSGDRVTIDVDGKIYEVTVPAMPLTVDIPTRRVFGSLSSPYTDADVMVKGQRVTLTTNFAGAFSASFIAIMELMPADAARVRFPIGQTTMETYAFAPGMLLRERSNEVVGYLQPGVSVTATLSTAGGDLKGTGSAVARASDGQYLLTFGEGAHIDITTGDRVEMITSVAGSPMRVATVMPLTAEVNLSADSVSGTAPAGQSLRVVVRHQGSSGVTWHVRQVVASGQGQYSASFAGEVGFRPEDEIWVTGRNGEHATEIGAQAHRVLIDQYNDTVEGVVGPDEDVTISLFDAGGTLMETQSAHSSSDLGFFEVAFASDIRSGQRVDALGASISASVPVVVISVLVDIDNDLLHIQGPPLSDLYGLHYSQSLRTASLYLRTDAAGQGQIDLAGYDLRDGDSGRLYYFDSAGHANLYRYMQPTLAASLNLGRVATWVDRNAPVEFALYDGSGSLKETASLVASERGWTDWWPAGGLAPDDRVTVACCGGRQAEVTLVDLTATPDIVNNVISGRAPVNALLNSEVVIRNLMTGAEQTYSKTTSSGINGTYVVDYNGYVDFSNDDPVRIMWQNADGDMVYVDRFCTRMSVNQSARAVYGQGLDNYAPASISLKNSQGTEKAFVQVDTDRYGSLDWTVLPAQIEFGDTVIVNDGDIVVTIPVDAVHPRILPEENRVIGAGLPNSRLVFYVEHPTGSGLWHAAEGLSGADGSFDVDLSDVVDVWAGDEIDVYHTNSAGHRIGVTQHALRLSVHQTTDEVQAWSIPGSLITLTLRSSVGDVKETRVLLTDPATGKSPREQFDADIRPGDTMESDNGLLSTMTTILPVGGRLDLDRNVVRGRVTPGSYMELVIYSQAGAQMTVEGWSDAEGVFEIGPGSAHQLAAGDVVDIWYTDENGQWLGMATNTVVSYSLPLIQRGG